jgi:hypothetical protein
MAGGNTFEVFNAGACTATFFAASPRPRQESDLSLQCFCHRQRDGQCQARRPGYPRPEAAPQRHRLEARERRQGALGAHGGTWWRISIPHLPRQRDPQRGVLLQDAALLRARSCRQVYPPRHHEGRERQLRDPRNGCGHRWRDRLGGSPDGRRGRAPVRLGEPSVQLTNTPPRPAPYPSRPTGNNNQLPRPI